MTVRDKIKLYIMKTSCFFWYTFSSLKLNYSIKDQKSSHDSKFSLKLCDTVYYDEYVMLLTF